MRFAVLASCICALAASATASPRTEVIVIGTVHEASSFYTADTLADILKRLKPGVVLLEGDPAFFEPKKGLKPQYRRGLEGSAATLYQEASGVAPEPFDIEGRDAFYKEIDYFTNQAALLRKLSELHTAGALSPEAMVLYEAVGAFSQVGSHLLSERPEVVNSAASDAAMKQKQHYIFEGIARIIELTPALKDFAAYWDKDRDFWVRRNETMIKNILSRVKTRGEGRIVVLCGFEHRNYLRDGLAKHADAHGFHLGEYWAQDA